MLEPEDVEKVPEQIHTQIQKTTYYINYIFTLQKQVTLYSMTIQRGLHRGYSDLTGDGKYRHLYVAVQLTKRNWLFIKAPILGVQWQSLKSEAKT